MNRSQWCWHHWHLFISQYQRTGFAQEEAPVADGWWELLALLPFPAWSARSRFWIRTQEIIRVTPNNWRSLVCVCRTVSSCWSSVSLASSSVILELACTNFSSAFQQWSCSAEALFSAILMLLVRLLWQSLYHLTFLSDTEDASSSIWRTMFGHLIQKAFSTSLDGISTVNAFNAFTTCKAYALHISHPSWYVVVINWGIPWMPQVLDLSPASNIFTAPCSGTLILLVSISGFIF